MITKLGCLLIAFLAGTRADADRLFDEGKWAEARVAYALLLESAEASADRAELLDRIGRTHIEEGSFWDAEGAFDDSIEAVETFSARLGRGRAFFYLGVRVAEQPGAMGAEIRSLMNDAAREVRRAIELDPGVADAWFLLGLCERYRLESEKEEESYRKALALEKGHPDAALYLSWIMELRGEHDAALGVLLEVPAERRAKGHHLALGRLSGLKGDFDGLKAAYLAAIDLDPGDPAGYDGLWKVTAFQKEFAAFRDLMGNVLKAHPGAWRAHYYLGFCHRYAREPKKAVAEFEKVLELNPDAVGALRRIADIRYRDLKDEDGAISVYLRVLDRDSSEDTARTVLGGLAIQRAMSGDLSMAHRIYTALRKAEPGEWSHTANLALVEKELGSTERALELYGEAEIQFPFVPRLCSDRGLLLMSLGREEEALAAFRDALDRDPEFLDALENLGAYSWLSGDPEAAIGYFKTALEKALRDGAETSVYRTYLDMLARAVEENR